MKIIASRRDGRRTERPSRPSFSRRKVSARGRIIRHPTRELLLSVSHTFPGVSERDIEQHLTTKNDLKVVRASSRISPRRFPGSPRGHPRGLPQGGVAYLRGVPHGGISGCGNGYTPVDFGLDTIFEIPPPPPRVGIYQTPVGRPLLVVVLRQNVCYGSMN